MSESLQQPTFDGLSARKRRTSRTQPKARAVAKRNPIAHVALNVQAPHLGRLFDYQVLEDQDELAVPGALVSVRFGQRARVHGVIWSRDDTTSVPANALKPLTQVMSAQPLVPESLREDIVAVARAYGGTPANVLRNAVPTYVKKVDKEYTVTVQKLDLGVPVLPEDVRARVEAQYGMLLERYERAETLRHAQEDHAFASFIWDCMPGTDVWARDLATLAAHHVVRGEQAVLVMPTQRHVQRMVKALQRLGLERYSLPEDLDHYDARAVVGVLDASLTPPERCASYLAVRDGLIRCVVGVRSAMYAPVEDHALWVMFDDCAYQNADGNMPHANARGVLRLRAQAHGGIFLAAGNARSATSEWETGDQVVATSVGGPSTGLHPMSDALRPVMPQVRWLNRDELARMADPTMGARIPHTAVRAIRQALRYGPVLLSIPHDGISESLSCVHCLRQARCMRCSGPLVRTAQQSVRCQWCAAAAGDWTCPHCHHDKLRVIRVGAAGTVQELRGLFRDVPLVVSSAAAPQGILESVDSAPKIVVAPVGDEPRVTAGEGTTAAYQAVAILDAWTSLYERGLDAYTETLNRWMHVVSLCAPRTHGGVALVLGETDAVLVNALSTWNSAVLARQECEERQEAVLPPAISAATIWGDRETVMDMLDAIGVRGAGEWATLPASQGGMPAVLGPVPIAPPRTLAHRDRMMEGMNDRVKAVVRVPTASRDALARRLAAASARFGAQGAQKELKYHMDPKDLM